jgi:pimeloyl-ACP methyl ester carboxylesterase
MSKLSAVLRLFLRQYASETTVRNFVKRSVPRAMAALALTVAQSVVCAQNNERVVDIPSRAGVTQRILLTLPAGASSAKNAVAVNGAVQAAAATSAKAVVVLFAGNHGGLQIGVDGSLKWGKGNFLVRSRQHFVDQGLAVAVIDAPSDRQSEPFLAGFRQTPEHAADVKAVIAWLREQTHAPVWLVGTSRGTQSVAYVATRLSGSESPDGIVLTSTVLADNRSTAVPAMPIERIRIPVLVAHHEGDTCRVCRFEDLPALTKKLVGNPRTELITFKGGVSTGDPCEAFAHHGFNGIERDVVTQITQWIVAK